MYTEKVALPMVEFAMKPGRLIPAALGCLVGIFVGFGILERAPVFGWIIILLCLFGVSSVILNFIDPFKNKLTISSDGVKMHYLFVKEFYLPWEDIVNIGYGKVSNLDSVLFVCNEGCSRYPSTRAMTRALANVDFSIPAVYGQTSEELAQLMTKYSLHSRGDSKV